MTMSWFEQSEPGTASCISHNVLPTLRADLTSARSGTETIGAFQVDLGGNIGGQRIVVDAIYLGGSVYESVPGISQIDPGKSWLSSDVSSLAKIAQSTSTNSLGANPLAALHALAQRGATVADLGPSTVSGQSVEDYSVTFDPSTLKNEMQNANLPSWMQKAVSEVTIKGGSEKVFLNGETLVQVSIALSLSAGTDRTVTLDETLGFSDYGSPVAISAPPAGEVVPLSQFLQLANPSGTQD